MNPIPSESVQRTPPIHNLLRVLVGFAALSAVVIGLDIPTQAASATHEASPAALGNPIVSIPFDDSTELVVVPLSINGSRDLRCILDTGMPEGAFLVDPALGTELGLEYVASVPVQGTGDATAMAGVAMGVRLSMGDVSISDQRVIVLEEASEVAHLGIDGVVGASFFSSYVVEIDPDTQSVNLYDPSTFDPDPNSEILPMTLLATRPYVDVRVAITGDEQTPLSLFVDTGANMGLLLNTPAIDGLRTPTPGLHIPVVTGVGGDVEGTVARVAALSLGRFSWEKLLCRFPDSSQGADQGVVGMGLLREFRVAFDYPGERLILAPSSRKPEPREFNMAGLVLRPSTNGHYLVHRVVAGSSGAEAGVHEGDTITALDHAETSTLTPRAVRQKFERDGESLLVALDRGGEAVELTLRLRRLI